MLKDPLGTKGARLSTQISIAGRMLVYLPQDKHIGISQRIGDEAGREALRERVSRLLPPNEPGGYIVRTMAENASDEELAADIAYLKAELKYLTVRTAERAYIYDGTLSEFEDRHAAHWLRIHRNALVARHAIRALEKHVDPLDPDDKGDGWAVRLAGVPEHLVVSRRQLAAVREALGST